LSTGSRHDTNDHCHRTLIKRRFQPRINTRISGVCLFSSGVVLTPDGGACPTQTRLLINPYARVPLLAWVSETIAAAGAEYERVLGPEQPDAPRAYSVHEMQLDMWSTGLSRRARAEKRMTRRAGNRR
jgi:hypothetical protein